jgi:hypothetical protein
MPFLALNRGSKQFGIQTYARAVKLAPPLKDPELEYLNMRDWYVNQIGLIAQLSERLQQAKAEGDMPTIKQLGGRLHTEEGKLVDVRRRARDIGERSWAEAFLLAATTMLPKESMSAIGQQADQLLGRQRHELKIQD